MNWMRVGAAALLTGACALLVACGSGVVSDLDFQKGTQLRSNSVPDKGRIMVLGDDFSDFGQGGRVYSVRDGTRNWIQELARHYDVTVRTAADGGWGYAQGHARVEHPDTTSGTSAPSVKAQVDALLAATSLRKNDAVFINGGMWDIIDAVETHGPEAEDAVALVEAAAKALAAQAKRLLDAGAGHVAVTGVYDLGTSPWAEGWERSDPRSTSKEADGTVAGLALFFNNLLLLELDKERDTGAVLYLDAAQFYRFVYDDDHDGYGIPDDDRRKNPFCSGRLGCDAPSGSDSGYNEYLFADDIHFTPRIWRAFGHWDYGENAYRSFSDRWGEP